MADRRLVWGIHEICVHQVCPLSPKTDSCFYEDKKIFKTVSYAKLRTHSLKQLRLYTVFPTAPAPHESMCLDTSLTPKAVLSRLLRFLIIPTRP